MAASPMAMAILALAGTSVGAHAQAYDAACTGYACEDGRRARSRGGPGAYRLNSLWGDSSDGGPAIKGAHYDFDASGPDEKSIAVTIVNRSATSTEYDKLLAERKAAARQRVGTLQQTSAAEFLATAPNGRLRWIENRPYVIYETFELPQPRRDRT
jgi:hypothetical protein